ncbi:MAG TPA: hypothetical protein VEL76_35920, partial [Gemmataceae bacterium]|nr:hypothetical protein [Gemmataceae bacterium]
VVGIACEGSGSPQEQARRVAATAESRHLNYTILLGAGKDCPVQQQFDVRLLPTIVLVGSDGQIIWRHTGPFDRAKLGELDRQIRIALGVN